jgi:Flp pilus assembly pilin Flp
MTDIATRIQATLYVFTARRDERGQTTAEYVGIIAFVALLIVALMGTTDLFGSHVNDIITAAFGKIKEKLG